MFAIQTSLQFLSLRGGGIEIEKCQWQRVAQRFNAAGMFSRGDPDRLSGCKTSLHKGVPTSWPGSRSLPTTIVDHHYQPLAIGIR